MNYLLIILLILASIIMLYQLMPYLASYKARGRQVVDLQGAIPESVLNHSRYLVYFWSPHCGMCRGMTPVIEKLMQERDNLAKVDISQSLKAAHALGVSATPAMVVVQNGNIEKVVLGVKPEAKIRELLQG